MQLLADKQYGDIQEIGRYAGPVMGKRGTGRLAGHKDFKKKTGWQQYRLNGRCRGRHVDG
jgi:hypothetical protein